MKIKIDAKNFTPAENNQLAKEKTLVKITIDQAKDLAEDDLDIAAKNLLLTLFSKKLNSNNILHPGNIKPHVVKNNPPKKTNKDQIVLYYELPPAFARELKNKHNQSLIKEGINATQNQLTALIYMKKYPETFREKKILQKPVKKEENSKKELEKKIMDENYYNAKKIIIEQRKAMRLKVISLRGELEKNPSPKTIKQLTKQLAKANVKRQALNSTYKAFIYFENAAKKNNSFENCKNGIDVLQTRVKKYLSEYRKPRFLVVHWLKRLRDKILEFINKKHKASGQESLLRSYSFLNKLSTDLNKIKVEDNFLRKDSTKAKLSI